MKRTADTNAPMLPGLELDIAGALQHKPDAKPTMPQQPCNIGLFAAGQADLLDAINWKTKIARITGADHSTIVRDLGLGSANASESDANASAKPENTRENQKPAAEPPKPAPHLKGPSSILKPKPKPDTASVSREKPNGGFILTPEQHEELGHQYKMLDQRKAANHYRLARVIRERLGIVTFH
jgi:hypothetical protein